MHKLVWFSLAAILCLFATQSFMNAVYWIIIGSDTELGVGFIAGSFVLPLILYYAAHKAWRRAADKQKEKKTH